MKRIVIAIGGNALNKPNEKPTAEVMQRNLLSTTSYLADLIEEGYEVVITHGTVHRLETFWCSKISPKEPFRRSRLTSTMP